LGQGCDGVGVVRGEVSHDTSTSAFVVVL
jgi:hypothetical protein